ncbi:MAG: murein biosynthesis integral membrane protein MurJ [Candidatus Gastranaerophilales bacterium]|nr:murein biosynthesis integral membrane protein MurJ [Candidatus Gastranaerophilales bacterium]
MAQEEIAEKVNDNRPNLLKSAGLIVIVILLSKIAGFLRDIVVANYYGASLVSDAYFYAYQIPALAIVILGGMGGPFHSATVSVFSKIIKNFNIKPELNVKKLFNTYETFSILIFGAIALICFFFPTQVMNIIISQASPELTMLAAQHLKIMSPVILVGALLGLYYGILVTYNHYLLPNIAPSMLSFGIILTLFFSKGDDTGFYLAIGTTIGALLQMLLQTPFVIKLGYTFKPCFDFFNNKNFKDILELLMPAFLSSTIGQIGIYVDIFFASSLAEGQWTAYGYANRIFQFPVGLMLSALLVPLFPLFSRLVVQEKFDEVRHYFNKGVGSLIFVGAYLMIFIFISRVDLISLALERGAFSHSATLMVSEVLFFISLSIIPYMFRDSITRLYYSFNDSKTPFYIAIGSIFLKLIFNSLLVGPMGINGIALSTTIITLINGTILAILIRKKISIGYRAFLSQIIKIVIAAAIAFLIGDFVNIILEKVLLDSFILKIVKVAIVFGASLLAYIISSYILKIEYMQDVKEKLVNKFIKRKKDAV